MLLNKYLYFSRCHPEGYASRDRERSELVDGVTVWDPSIIRRSPHSHKTFKGSMFNMYQGIRGSCFNVHRVLNFKYDFFYNI